MLRFLDGTCDAAHVGERPPQNPPAAAPAHFSQRNETHGEHCESTAHLEEELQAVHGKCANRGVARVAQHGDERRECMALPREALQLGALHELRDELLQRVGGYEGDVGLLVRRRGHEVRHDRGPDLVPDEADARHVEEEHFDEARERGGARRRARERLQLLR
jgi:hypothetical protein